MFLPVAAYSVVDVNDRHSQLAVVCEATSRKEVSDYLAAHGLAKCNVFKESGEELYRGICPVITVTTDTDRINIKRDFN